MSVQPPLLAQVIGTGGLATSQLFAIATDELGATLTLALLQTVTGNVTGAVDLTGATLSFHVRPFFGPDFALASVPAITSPSAAGKVTLTLQANDMALLSPGFYRALVRAVLSDGSQHDFPGITLSVLSPDS